MKTLLTGGSGFIGKSQNCQHIIFDLDGTIIDSKKEIIKTYELVFSKVIPTVIPDLNSLNYGATINDLLKGVYQNDTDKIKKAKILFASIYDNSDYLETNCYDGVMETLKTLKLADNELYIATNKRYMPTLRILKKKNIAHYFSDIMANEMQPNITLSKQQMILELKNKYSFSNGFMVGDSAVDIEAGNDQNLKTIAVTYGYENTDIFVTKNPTYIIDSFYKIINLVLN